MSKFATTLYNDFTDGTQTINSLTKLETIKQIDGIDVFSTIKISNIDRSHGEYYPNIKYKYEIKFIIDIKGLNNYNNGYDGSYTLYSHYDYLEKINIEEIDKSLLNFKTFITNAKFDKTHSEFINAPRETEMDKAEKDYFENKFNISDNCVVCNEETDIMTKCNHKLCIPCHLAIKKSYILENKCPVCKTNLKNIIKKEKDEDEDEEN